MKNKMPKGEARPLGTPKPKKVSQRERNIIFSSGQKLVDSTTTSDVDSSNLNKSDPTITSASSPNHAAQEHTNMTTITLTRDTKARKSTSIVYLSPNIKGGVRIAKSAFQNGEAPETLDVSSDHFAQPKPKETKEERKTRLATMPKLTLAEKIAKREKQLEALKAKAAAVPAV